MKDTNHFYLDLSVELAAQLDETTQLLNKTLEELIKTKKDLIEPLTS